MVEPTAQNALSYLSRRIEGVYKTAVLEGGYLRMRL